LPGGGQHLTRHGGLAQLLVTPQLNSPDRLVVDETGLEGEFDWELTIRDQLGLQLVPGDAEVDVVVIDAVSMPTPN
jgi:hypothetical protein